MTPSVSCKTWDFFYKKLAIEKKKKENKKNKRVIASFVGTPSQQEEAPSPHRFLLIKLG
jgi:hypothetical protein